MKSILDDPDSGHAVEVMCPNIDQGKGPETLYKDSGMFRCSIAIGLMFSHGSLIGEMSSGACVKNIINPDPVKPLELSWCTRNQSACDAILNALGFLVPVLPLFILLLLHWVMQRKDTAVWNDGLKKRTGNIEMKCLAGHLDSMEEEAITGTPTTEPAAHCQH